MTQARLRRGNAPVRQGPRPLALHLMAAQSAWMSSIGALPLLRNGSHDWKLNSALASVLEDLDGLPLDSFGEAVINEILVRLDRLLTGIERYRSHPYHRDLSDPPALWTEGTTRLLDYGATAAQSPGRPVLFVPSLVNRA